MKHLLSRLLSQTAHVNDESRDSLRVLNRIADALGIALVLLAGVVLFSPSGYGRRFLRDFADSRARKAAIEQEWGGLTRRARAQTDAAGFAVIVSSVDCIYCRMLADSLAAREDGKPPLKFLVIEKAIRSPERSAAFAARMICDEGRDSYAKVYQLLMKTTPAMLDNSIPGLSDSATVDQVDLTSTRSGCVRADSTADRLRHDTQLVSELKVSVTPTFVNRHGQLLEGLTSLEEVRRFANR